MIQVHSRLGGLARAAFLLVLLVGALSNSGCATIFKGSSQKVTIKSNTPGAKLKIDGVPSSFGEQTMKRDRTYFVQAEAPGYEPRSVKIEQNFGAAWIIPDIFAGFVGILVDAITGAWNNLEPYDIDLTQQPSAPAGKGGGGGAGEPLPERDAVPGGAPRRP